MKYLYFISLFFIIDRSVAQKPLVNDTTYLSWTKVDNGTLSPTGNYVYYRIENEPRNLSTWVIKATNRSWEYRSTRFKNLNFSPDGKYLFAMQGDSLIKLRLHSNDFTVIPSCKRYELFSKGKSDWIIYTLNDEKLSVSIQNLKTGNIKTLNNILEYSINRNGATIVSKLKPLGRILETIQWTNINTGQSKIIYRGGPIKNLIYDLSGNRMAFDSTNDKGQTEIWYYENGWKSSKIIASDNSSGITRELKITTDETWRFSEDGYYLFFNLTNKTAVTTNLNSGISIHHYRDLYLLEEYNNIAGDIDKGKNLSILNINTKKIRQLLFGEQRIAFESPNREQSDVFIVQDSKGKLDELKWNKRTHLSYYIVFAKTGKIAPIKENCLQWIVVMALSPDNNFVVYYDPETLKYLSYNVKNGRIENIGQNLSKEFSAVQYNSRSGPGVQEGTFGLVGWIKDTKKVIVHGTYDLWELDLENNVAPRNITNGVGEKNQLIFANLPNKLLDDRKSWILTAFNMITKDAEIFSFNYRSKKLTLLCKMQTTLATTPVYPPKNIQKANLTDTYLIKLGNSHVSPNFISTKNFKDFDTLSNIFPERRVNWLVPELGKYYDKFGRDCQGIIYKPENFDPSKKYPIIFYYYLEAANQLNAPIDVEPSTIGVNIPILVSNGYIVCRPTIYAEVNKPGESALLSVSAAADYLKQFSWVDSAKMGVIGHSRGGYETEYIVTHSTQFRAAVSAAGISNLIEYYNNANLSGGGSNHNYFKSAMLMSGGLEELPDTYIDNSPIFAARGMSTPLLLMHNNDDVTVPVSQSKEFFTLLRSLQKPVWLLQYDDEAHMIGKLEYQIDFQNKVKDFFDHYLKGKPIPQWMNNPIK
jgi:dipeptidyl aminopeptidase/acylaminoacyl peptidase